MPQYLVRFERPVVYQPDHPTACQTITELVVSGASDGPAAIAHALRTTRGDGGAVSAHLVGVPQQERTDA
jgi:hypothetical protein